MKKILAICFMIFGVSAHAEFKPAGSESESIKEAVKDGYQVQRNLAYDYDVSRGVKGDANFIPKDRVKACAWRKILLISNPSKIDSSDSSNERYSCEKLDSQQDEQAWHIVHQYLPLINELKQKGQYMIIKEEPELKDEDKIIIDVDNEENN